ncbi:Uncharacterised protein [Mycobacteroides abscessus]|nr:Uncharacterised protein [Mycobacteroides abscessus]CQA08294.1 Uncharacterised protein [Mycobacteroides abscessus]CQA11670.1 Uncharacterised protein [Mycobacteroides abscessus]
MGAEGVKVGLDDGPPILCGTCHGRGIDARDIGVGLLDDALGEGEEYGLFGGEVEVEGRPGDPGSARQIIDRDIGKRALAEQFLGGGQDRLYPLVPGRARRFAASRSRFCHVYLRIL